MKKVTMLICMLFGVGLVSSVEAATESCPNATIQFVIAAASNAGSQDGDITYKLGAQNPKFIIYPKTIVKGLNAAIYHLPATNPAGAVNVCMVSITNGDNPKQTGNFVLYGFPSGSGNYTTTPIGSGWEKKICRWYLVG